MTWSPTALANDDDETLVVGRERDSFLGSHRALSVCTREFARLADEIARRTAALRGDVTDEEPKVRLTPERCIVQMGPVALTLSWLRSTPDSAAEGRLLAAVWRGQVAPRPTQVPERARGRVAQTATTLWEETLFAEATCEADWRWHPEGGKATGGYDAAALAERCVAPLRAALQA